MKVRNLKNRLLESLKKLENLSEDQEVYIVEFPKNGYSGDCLQLLDLEIDIEPEEVVVIIHTK